MKARTVGFHRNQDITKALDIGLQPGSEPWKRRLANDMFKWTQQNNIEFEELFFDKKDYDEFSEYYNPTRPFNEMHSAQYYMDNYMDPFFENDKKEVAIFLEHSLFNHISSDKKNHIRSYLEKKVNENMGFKRGQNITKSLNVGFEHSDEWKRAVVDDFLKWAELGVEDHDQELYNFYWDKDEHAEFHSKATVMPEFKENISIMHYIKYESDAQFEDQEEELTEFMWYLFKNPEKIKDYE